MLLRVIRLILAAVLLGGLLATDATAQDPSNEPLEVNIVVESFGVGQVARPGGWAGVRLALTDLSDRPRAVAVRFEVPDPDGDTTIYQRNVTLNPGVAQGVWLYPSLPWTLERSSAFTVSVRSIDVDAIGAEGDLGSRVGRQLAAAAITPQAVVFPSVSLIGVLGQSPAGGLVAYDLPSPGDASAPATAHELTRLVGGLTPASFPDRWMGLAQYDTLVWLDGAPGELNERQAQALAEWVRRGGHLVISIPPAGQTWTNPRANPLHDMLPAVALERREGVDLNADAALLRPAGDIELPARAVVHEFALAEDAPVEEASVILARPDGAPVVVRRLVDAGAVTLIGYNLADTRLAARLDPKAFWHRVLGRRFETPTRDELRTLAQAGNATFGFRDVLALDADLAPLIAKQGRAGAGVLLGLIVFAAYLVLAGPGGFALLRMRGLTRHAWVAFVAAVGVFTLVAWGGATAIRPRVAEIQHVSFLDHVFGQPNERARVWFSALLPEYGDATIALGAEEDRAAWTQALAPWTDRSGGGGSRPFPDTRGYVVDTRTPDSLTVPTRSTVREFRGDWLGAARWGTPRPVGGPLRIGDEEGRSRLVGSLVHDMPAPLRDITVLLVRQQAPLQANLGTPGSGPLLSVVTAFRPPDWAPGETLDLGAIPVSAQELGDTFLDRLTESLQRASPTDIGPVGMTRAGGRTSDRLTALALHPILRPPQYLARTSTRQALLQRAEAMGADVASWFTHPAVVIIAHMEDAPTPMAITIDGREPPSSGRVVLRWVYPLPSNPPATP